MHIFPFWQTASNSKYGEIIGVGKCTLISHSGISVIGSIQIHEQNNSIATGPLYVHSEFEVI